MCLAEFAATFATNRKHTDDNEDASGNDVLPSTSTVDQKPAQINLTDDFGKMTMRPRAAVIRFHRYNMEAERSNWFRAKLMLYFPWFDEAADLLGGYATFEEHYFHVQSVVLANERKCTQEHVDEMQLSDSGPPQHAWDQLAPGTEANRANSLAEGSLVDNANLFTTSTTSTIHTRYESAANSHEIPPEEYRKLLRGLNTKQKQIVMFHRNWCKQAVVALKQGKPVEPYRVFVSGPGGVGKSHVIKMIHSDTIRLLRLSGTIEPDDVIVLLTAPTGVAAFIKQVEKNFL